MDSAHQHSFINPTTCFTVACVAFSLLAISAVWKNQQSTQSSSSPSSNDRKLPKSATRPPAVHRRGVDSLYVRDGAGQDPQRTVQQPKPPDPVAVLSELITLSASLATSLRSRRPAEGSRQLSLSRTTSSLLGELSLITTSLCRLQQQVVSNSSWFAAGSGLFACFSTTTSSLNETFCFLQAGLASDATDDDATDDDALHLALQQLRDQRPALEFLLESANGVSLPPTPPCDDAEIIASPWKGSPVKQNLMLPPPPTGLTPAIDAKGWIEPPPEYSPPAQGSMQALAVEKGDEKTAHPAPPETQDSSSDTSIDEGELYDAVTSDDTDLISSLLEHGADANAPYGELQRTPLHQAAHLNHTTNLSLLIKSGGAIMTTEDAKGDTPLHLAAWAGHVEALSTLLAHGADVDWLSGRDGYSPLWCAISGSHIDAARLLLKHGARVSLRSASGGGLMPLHQAAVTGQSAMCELLLERGAQVDALDDEGNTALHYASASGSLKSVKSLLHSHADVTLAQTQGLTPAHWAAHKGHTDVLALLLAYGAPVNATAEDGATPLHCAANRGHLATARLLLEKGARRKGKASWDGVEGTPADMAKNKGHARVAKTIETWRKAV